MWGVRTTQSPGDWPVDHPRAIVVGLIPRPRAGPQGPALRAALPLATALGRGIIVSCLALVPLGVCSEEPEGLHAPFLPSAHAIIPQPKVGERLSFRGWWMGFPVGNGWIEVKEVVELDGQQAYHIEAQGHSNALLSVFYPIHDVLHAYLDIDTFQPLRVEKDQQEGRYRAHEVVQFNPVTRTATYRSLLNQSVKEITLPPTFQDLISAVYWIRAQPLQPPGTLSLNLYTDEKIYETAIHVSAPRPVELLKRGTFQCVLLEPKASFKGLLVKRGRLWAYFSADAHRLPLLVRITTPWGVMSAVLDASSIPSSHYY